MSRPPRETTFLFSVSYAAGSNQGIVPMMDFHGPTVSREEKQTAAPENHVSRQFPTKSCVFNLKRAAELPGQAIAEPRIMS